MLRESVMRHCVSEWLRPYRIMLAACGLSLLGLAIAGPAHAEDVAGLYEAEVPVSSQERAERQTALGEALRAVLVKVSGDRQPERRPAVAKTLKRASRLLLAYDYHRIQPSTVTDISAEIRPEKSDLMLRARFDPKAVESLLTRAELPIWGRARPSLLVWLAVEEGGLRYLISQSTEHPLHEAMTGVAGQRGLPLHLPMLDAQDQTAIQFMDIWADFADVVKSASRRYSADRVLVGRLYRDPAGFWGARWTLYSAGQPQAEQSLTWEEQHQSPDEAVAAGLDVTADSLAKQFAVHYHASDDQQALILQVEGVSSLSAYARVSSYLESLEPVIRVTPSRVQRGQLRFELQVRGGIDALHQAIALGRILADVPDTGLPTIPSTAGLPVFDPQTVNTQLPESQAPEKAAPVLRYRLLP